MRVVERCKSNGKEVERPIQRIPGLFLPCLFSKTVADAMFAGRVSYFKVISGVLKNDAHLINSRSSVDERLAHIGAIFGKNIQQLGRAACGRYRRGREAARHLEPGDTLADKAAMIRAIHRKCACREPCRSPMRSAAKKRATTKTGWATPIPQDSRRRRSR